MSAKLKFFIINLIDWVSKEGATHFIFSTEDRANKSSHQLPNGVKKYTTNNYYADLSICVELEVVVRDPMSDSYPLEIYRLNDAFKLDSVQTGYFGDAAPMIIEQGLALFELETIVGLDSRKFDKKITTSYEKLERFKNIENFEYRVGDDVIRFSKSDRITLAILVTLSDQFGSIEINYSQIKQLTGKSNKSFSSFIDRLAKVGLINKSIGGFSTSKILKKSRTKILLSPKFIFHLLKFKNADFKISEIENPLRYGVGLLTELSSIKSYEERLNIITSQKSLIMASQNLSSGLLQRSIRNKFPTLIENTGPVMRALATLSPTQPQFDRPHKHLCLIVESIVLRTIKKHIDSSLTRVSDNTNGNDSERNIDTDSQGKLLLEMKEDICNQVLKFLNDGNIKNEDEDSFLNQFILGLCIELTELILNVLNHQDEPSDAPKIWFTGEFGFIESNQDFFSTNQPLLLIN